MKRTNTHMHEAVHVLRRKTQQRPEKNHVLGLWEMKKCTNTEKLNQAPNITECMRAATSKEVTVPVTHLLEDMFAREFKPLFEADVALPSCVHGFEVFHPGRNAISVCVELR